MQLSGEIKTTGDRAEINKCLVNILRIDNQIKLLKEDKANWIDQLINEDPKFRYKGPEFECFFGKQKKTFINNNDVFDYLSIPDEVRTYFSKNCFLAGVLKKEEGCKDMVKDDYIDKLEFKKINPDFTPKKK